MAKRPQPDAGNPAPKRVVGRPFAKGGDPRQMDPREAGKLGGRPRDEWKAKLRELASRDRVLEHVASVLEQGPEHPYFDRALQYCTDHGYGKAIQAIDVTSDGQQLAAPVVLMPALDLPPTPTPDQLTEGDAVPDRPPATAPNLRALLDRTTR